MTGDSAEAGRVVLVGGNGFIGKHLARELREQFPVRVLDRPGSQPIEGVEFLPGDLAAGPEEILPQLVGCDSLIYLVHLAGSSPHRDPDMLALVKNLELFLNTLEAAHHAGIRKVVFFSSGGSVYGIPRQIPIPEDHPLEPISAYGLCKLTMEKYLAMFAREHGMRHIVVRPSNPYGPGQDFRRLQGVIAVFTHRILQGEPLEIWGTGEGRKDYFAVEDLARAVRGLLAASEASGTYNVGSGSGCSLLEIIAAIEEVTGKKANVVFREQRANDVPEFVLDCARLHMLTGWQPEKSLREGVEGMVRWMGKP